MEPGERTRAQDGALQEVALVGAGNSAGQAAVYLATHAAKVWMLVRGRGLEASMSRYLIERIDAQPKWSRRFIPIWRKRNGPIPRYH